MLVFFFGSIFCNQALFSSVNDANFCGVLHSTSLPD